VYGALALADGRILSWGTWGRDKALRLWSADGALLTVMDGHMGEVVYGAQELADGRILSWADDGYRVWTADGAPLGAIMWRAVLHLPRPREGHLRWWDHDGEALAHGDFTIGRVDALYVHDAPIREIAPLSPTRCALTDDSDRLYFLEYRDGRVTVR